jgi:hypothetical protein
VLYHLYHAPIPFCFGYFWEWISPLCSGWHELWSFYYASQVAGMTGLCHHTHIFIGWEWISLTLLRCLQTIVLPISTSWVAKIMVVSHHSHRVCTMKAMSFTLRRWSQEDWEFKDSLHYRRRPFLKENFKKTKTKEMSFTKNANIKGISALLLEQNDGIK